VYNVQQQNSLFHLLDHVDFTVKMYVYPLGYVYWAPNFESGVLYNLSYNFLRRAARISR